MRLTGRSRCEKSPRGRAGMGQACEEMSQREAGHRVAPVRGNGKSRGKNEVALAERTVRHAKRARLPATAAPQDDVDIEHACSPALVATATEVFFQLLDPNQQCRRIHVCGDDGSGVGVAAARRSQRRGGDDRRTRLDSATGRPQGVTCGSDDLAWTAMAAVTPIRAKCEEVGVARQALRYPARCVRRAVDGDRGRSPFRRGVWPPGRDRSSPPAHRFLPCRTRPENRPIRR